MESPTIRFAKSIKEIGFERWNALSGTHNPFTRYEFLHALETTGCTTRESGWQPRHVYVERDGKALAVMPLYEKTNSWGEYVFDWSWANAYQGHGMSYYPKLVTAAPFTPSVGKRFFIADGENESDVLRLIVDAVTDKAEAEQFSSWHVLFPSLEQHEQLNNMELLARNATQFKWSNPGYQDFDDFLGEMNSRKRKSIRKERKKVAESGIRFRRTEGADITEQQWGDFYLFYQSTYLMRGQQGYLSQDFFLRIAETMPEQLLLVNAVQDGRDIAGALFFKNSDTLFGRYWGSAADYQFLHFETCYYQGQDYAIERGIKTFDSGAQGEHKIQRGFTPITTTSNHWIAHEGFRMAIADFLEREKEHVEGYKADAATLLPFKQEDRETR
jgi:predicted N-acyltransferase